MSDDIRRAADAQASKRYPFGRDGSVTYTDRAALREQAAFRAGAEFVIAHTDGDTR